MLFCVTEEVQEVMHRAGKAEGITEQTSKPHLTTIVCLLPLSTHITNTGSAVQSLGRRCSRLDMKGGGKHAGRKSLVFILRIANTLSLKLQHKKTHNPLQFVRRHHLSRAMHLHSCKRPQCADSL